ncbi:MAG: hypothetical protein M3Y50_15255 [Acidobacteriota bacterium]|nr:hypothetical protein [Acidobacteriota bacterium]
MKVTVERLRVWLLAGACLLVLVIAGFLGYARYRAHRFFRDLPKKLGVDIRRETNGYTLSQSVQGRTVYTIHAAKAVERLDGKVTLHDVGIVLYGRNNDRDDRIYGNEFEYDQKTEVIRAVGEVHIDLQAPEAANANKKMDYAAGKDLHGPGGSTEVKDARLIHVTTSGLVFLRKLGVAATENEIEFESGGMTGHAVGADYSSDTGVVVLHSQVKMNGLEHDRPVVLTATRAELDRPDQKVVLTQAKYVAVGESGNGAGGTRHRGTQTAQGQHVVMHVRKDGSAERVEADGEVILTDGDGGKVSAPRAEMILSEGNQPRSATLSGGVRYSSEDLLREAQGEAAEGRVAFDAAGRPERVAMSGAVHLRERVRASQGAPWSERALQGATAELVLATGAAGTAHLQDAKASGNAKLKMSTFPAKADKNSPVTSDLAADVLAAHLIEMQGRDHVAEVHGNGRAMLHRVDAKGVATTTSADSLVAHFKRSASGAEGMTNRTEDRSHSGLGGQERDEISDALEQGHVVMSKLAVKRPGDAGAPVEERATADKAFYDGEHDRTTLTGSVVVSDGESVLRADRVVSEQQSGDVAADGSVKVAYTQGGSAAEPVHVLAARAEMNRGTQTATFYGTREVPARLWQGTSQVDAPVLQLNQKQKRLLAHGSGLDTGMPVRTVLSSGNRGAKKTGEHSAADAPAAGGKTEVIRVESRELAYADEARRADFTGGVEVQSTGGEMRGQQAEVYLMAAPLGNAAGANSRIKPGTSDNFLGGSVERIVASGGVALEQAGRRATGARVVYTASDGMFVLTGTPEVLPKVIDDQRGTVSGTSLQFHAGGDSIVISNGGSGAGERVRTETRVKNRK